jgi:hypothetical protein
LGSGGGGGVTYTSPTVNAVPIVTNVTSPGTLGNSLATDNGTAFGYTGSGGFSSNGGLTVGGQTQPAIFNAFGASFGNASYGYAQAANEFLTGSAGGDLAVRLLQSSSGIVFGLSTVQMAFQGGNLCLGSRTCSSQLTATGAGSFGSLLVNSSQALTSVQGTAGTKLPAASGTFTNGNLRSTNSTGDEVDSGIAASSVNGNAATATKLSTNGTSLQVWGMNSGASAQGWQTISGSGTVNSGTAGVISYYATTGTAVSGDTNLDDGITTADTLTYAGTGGVSTPKVSVTGSGTGFIGPAAGLYSSLAACSTSTVGWAIITDSTTQTWGATVSGTGTPATPYTTVFCDGSVWTVMGK